VAYGVGIGIEACEDGGGGDEGPGGLGDAVFEEDAFGGEFSYVRGCITGVSVYFEVIFAEGIGHD